MSSYSPPLSLHEAIHRPSGDQAGNRSAAPDECVRLRTAPCRAGTVKISPRASNTARCPVGEIPAEVMRFATSAVRGTRAARSVTTSTATSETRSVARSMRKSRPPAWKTRSDGPMAGNVMSKSVKVVTCRFAPVVRSWAQMLYRWAGPRSERKYSVSSCHIGWASLAGLSLTFSASSVSRSRSQISGAAPPR